MTHLLTDKIIEKQFGRYDGIDDVMVYDEDDIRSAVDWQLEQVIDWLRNNLDESYIWAYVMPPGIDVESVIDDLKQEMRPQENN
tara:strand:+ start:512 stop:763 length:252 start_codon:yes stop_codon:yes gene_type:complete